MDSSQGPPAVSVSKPRDGGDGFIETGSTSREASASRRVGENFLRPLSRMGTEIGEGAFGPRGDRGPFVKGLILAQNERWRRGLGMQVERVRFAGPVAEG